MFLMEMWLQQPTLIDRVVQPKRGRGRGRPSRENYVSRPFPVDPLVAQLRDELMINFGNAGWTDIALRLRKRLRELDGKDENTHDN